MIFELLGEAEKFRIRQQLPIVPRWLQQAKDYVHENARSGISLNEVAVLVEVHPSYLTRLFRKFYHCSIGDYVQKVRLEHSVHELVKTSKSLSQIAAEAGFYDQSHFTRSFKLFLKMTPGDFRSAVRKGDIDTNNLGFSNNS